MTETDFDELLKELLGEFAEIEGEYYMALNERLQADPDASVPADLDERVRKLLEEQL